MLIEYVFPYNVGKGSCHFSATSYNMWHGVVRIYIMKEKFNKDMMASHTECATLALINHL